MQDFRNLSVWQRARRLTKSVYEMTADGTNPGSASRRVSAGRAARESRRLTQVHQLKAEN